MTLGIISLVTYLVYFFLYYPDVQVCSTRSRVPKLANCDIGANNPVCALYYGSNCIAAAGFCKITFANQCLACLDRSVVAILPGSCDQNKFQKCNDQMKAKCDPSFQEPVCAFVKEQGCASQLFPRTIVNSCVACSFDDTLFYHDGRCPDYNPEIFRSSDRYPEACTIEYMPHCTYYREGSRISRGTNPNLCTSCFESKAMFYVEGFCEPEEDELLTSGPFEFDLEPVEAEAQV